MYDLKLRVSFEKFKLKPGVKPNRDLPFLAVSLGARDLAFAERRVAHARPRRILRAC